MKYPKNINLISDKRLDEMIDRGWHYKPKKLSLDKNSMETDDAFYTRLINEGYTKVKLYKVTTRTRGYHHTVALVKR